VKLYLERLHPRRAVAEPASPPPPPPLLGSAELLAELDAFAGRAATSPVPGAAAVIVADLVDDIADHLRDLADVAQVPRPLPAVFDAAAVADRSWTLTLTEAISAASAALGGRSARRREPWDAQQRRFEGQRHIGQCRTALRSANRRLQTVADREATRERLAAKGKLRLTRDKVVRR